MPNIDKINERRMTLSHFAEMQNSADGREKYVKAINFQAAVVQWSRGPVV